MHVLLAADGFVTNGMLKKAWNLGRCDIRGYDARAGAAYYVAKYTARAETETGISSTLPPLIAEA